jgi:hypothetical protein
MKTSRLLPFALALLVGSRIGGKSYPPLFESEAEEDESAESIVPVEADEVPRLIVHCRWEGESGLGVSFSRLSPDPGIGTGPELESYM